MTDKYRLNEDDLKPGALENLPKKETEVKVTTDELKVPEQAGISFGIEETLDVVDLAISLANSTVKALADGKVGITDIPHFISPLIKLPAAITGIEQVPSEVGDIDEIELEKLINHVKSSLDVDNEKAMEIVQRSLTLIYDVYNLVKII